MTIFHDSRAALGHPFWWDDAGPRPDLPDAPPARVDLVVVGAGFTGLSAALAARDAGADVAVIDAGWPGAGASSRNGGMFGAHPRLPFDTLAKQFGESVATGVTRESLAAFQHTKGLIDNERIACDFEVTGRLLLAWTRAHHEGQKRLAAAVSKAGGGTAELVPKDALQAEIATDRYFGGLRFPDHAALQPRKFHDGLLAAALKRDIPVIADCPALRVQRTIDGFRVETPKGEIRARRLVAATNGYTDGAFQRLRARVFPLPSFLIATEPLSPNLVAALAPGRRMYVETRARHSYYRVSPDGSRILFGGRASMRPIDLRTAAARLRATMCDIWPDLEEVPGSPMSGPAIPASPSIRCPMSGRWTGCISRWGIPGPVSRWRLISA